MFGPFWISEFVILCRIFGFNARKKGFEKICGLDPQVPIDPS